MKFNYIFLGILALFMAVDANAMSRLRRLSQFLPFSTASKSALLGKYNTRNVAALSRNYSSWRSRVYTGFKNIGSRLFRSRLTPLMVGSGAVAGATRSVLIAPSPDQAGSAAGSRPCRDNEREEEKKEQEGVKEWGLSADILDFFADLSHRNSGSRNSLEHDLMKLYQLYQESITGDNSEKKIEYARKIRQKFFQYKFEWADCSLDKRKDFMKQMFEYSVILGFNPTHEILKRICYSRLPAEENGELAQYIIELNHNIPARNKFDFNKKFDDEFFRIWHGETFLDLAVLNNKLSVVKALIKYTDSRVTEKTILFATKNNSAECWDYFMSQGLIPSKSDITQRINELQEKYGEYYKPSNGQDYSKEKDEIKEKITDLSLIHIELVKRETANNHNKVKAEEEESKESD